MRVSTEPVTDTIIEAAKYIGMSRSFLRQDRMNGYREGGTRGSDFLKFKRAVRYRIEEVLALK